MAKTSMIPTYDECSLFISENLSSYFHEDTDLHDIGRMITALQEFVTTIIEQNEKKLLDKV